LHGFGDWVARRKLSGLGIKGLRRKPASLDNGKPAKADHSGRNESMKVDTLQVRCDIAGHAGRQRLRPQNFSGPRETVRCAPWQQEWHKLNEWCSQGHHSSANPLPRCAAKTLVGRGVRALRPTGLQGAILEVRADGEVTRHRFRAQGARRSESFVGWNWNRSQSRWAYRSSSQASRGRLWSDHGGENGSGKTKSELPLGHAARKSGNVRAESLRRNLRQARPPKVAGVMAPEFPQYGGGDDYTALRK
jgi:hypothetical protein